MIAIGYVGFVGFNLTFDVHKKPDTFTLLNHYTVVMALACRIIVNKKEVFIGLFVEYALFLCHNLCLYTCRKPVVLEKQFFLFHVLDLNPIFGNQYPSPL